MVCSCCGEERDLVVPLLCHDDVKVCRVCIGWLRGQSGAVDVTTTLPVADMAAATAFYEAAGFDVRLYEGGGFAFVTYEDESVFDLDVVEHLDPAVNASGCYLIVQDVDNWNGRLSSLGATVTPVGDMEWGMREFRLTDPSGNSLRFGTPLG